MNIRMLLLIILTITLSTVSAQARCASKYQYIHGKKMMSDCAWKAYVVSRRTSHTTYDFSKTYRAESNHRFDAVNRNDSGKGMSLGIVQFNSTYARKLSAQLGIKAWMSTSRIKRKLRTQRSRKAQMELFNEAFVCPILSFTTRKGITNKRVIEFLVDWRVNGMPKRYYSRINKHTTINQLVAMRNARYRLLHRLNPSRYPITVLRRWLKRSNDFLT